MQQLDFSIPGTGGQYDSNTITFPYKVRKLTVIVLEAPPTSAEITVDVKGTDGVWYTDVASLTEKGISEVADFADAAAEVRVRGKSGGTSGNVQVAAIASRRPE